MARRRTSFSNLPDSVSKLWRWAAGTFAAPPFSRSAPLVAGASTNRIAVESLLWRDFERLVGEAFRARGYMVTGFGGGAAEGAVDLGLTRNGERFLVQCKHWRKQQVGLTVLSELNRVISAQGARGGFVVTGGQFTKEAREFSRSTRIELIDGKSLGQLLGSIPARNACRTTAVKATS